LAVECCKQVEAFDVINSLHESQKSIFGQPKKKLNGRVQSLYEAMCTERPENYCRVYTKELKFEKKFKLR